VIEWARTQVLGQPAASLDPDTLRFLLRHYVAEGDPLVRDRVEAGLTAGLDLAARHSDPCRRLQWVRLLGEAAVLSDDPRLREAVVRELPGAIEGLETRVRRTYEPGEGLSGEPCAAQLACASALLDAFDLSGRLPYAMLADELLQFARRTWWNDGSGAYGADCEVNGVALGVTCRLIALHADPEYRSVAVLPPGGVYRGDAARLAGGLGQRLAEQPHAAGPCGAALLAWFALEPDLQ